MNFDITLHTNSRELNRIFETMDLSAMIPLFDIALAELKRTEAKRQASRTSERPIHIHRVRARPHVGKKWVKRRGSP